MSGKRIYVITGGPSTGKTEVINELERRNYHVFHEASRRVSETDERFKGMNIGEVISEIGVVPFNHSIIKIQKFDYSSIDGGIAYSDRGLADNWGYLKHYKLEDKIPSLVDDIKNYRYSGVFVCDHLGFYKKDKFRTESEEEQKLIHERLIEAYEEHDYNPFFVPNFGSEGCAGLHPDSEECIAFRDESVSERVNFILKNVQNL